MKQPKNSSVTHRSGGQLEHLLVENPLMATVKLSRYKFVSKMLNPSDVVVDIGCGSGLSTNYFSKYCSRVVGCDNSSELKNSWPQEVPENLTFVHSDIFEFVPPSDLSAVVCLDFIEHFNRQEGEEIVRWAAVSLRKRATGGLFICGTPSRYSQQYRAAHNLEQHLHEYEPNELRELCETHFDRVLMFSMNDELVHTGFDKLAWYTFAVCIC